MLAKVFTRNVVNARTFSSLGAVAENNYSRFRAAYIDNLSKFKSTMDSMDETRETTNLKNKKAFSPPFENEHYEVNCHPSKFTELIHDFIGPEQVSPHYESFLASRKWAIGFWTTCLTLGYIGNSLDFHWVARSCIIPFVFWTTQFYWILEGRKHLVKP